MDDLIVIILTIVIILAGVLGQLKKKPAEEEKNIEDGLMSEDDLWILPGESEDVRSKFQKTTKKDDKYKEKIKEEKRKSNEGSEIYSYDLTDIDEIKNTGKSVKKFKFPLRKAVIYSEILNRKYF